MTDTTLGALLYLELTVPIRSSSGGPVDPGRVAVEAIRYGTDERGRFLPAYTSPEAYIEFGPPGSDAVELAARELFIRAEAAGDRVVIDAGSPAQLEVPAAALPFLAAGIEPTTAEAMPARRTYGGLPALEVPAEVPEPFGSELRRELTKLPQVAQAWLLRAGTSWRLGVLLAPDAELFHFDQVRNRAHAVATKHLASRRELAVTDLRAQPVREAYKAAGGPWYIRPPDKLKGFLGRLCGD